MTTALPYVHAANYRTFGVMKVSVHKHPSGAIIPLEAACRGKTERDAQRQRLPRTDRSAMPRHDANERGLEHRPLVVGCGLGMTNAVEQLHKGSHPTGSHPLVSKSHAARRLTSRGAGFCRSVNGVIGGE